MAQRLVSELVLKLTQQVSGPAAEARKALASIDQAMAAIAKHRIAQTAVADLARAYEAARARVRSLRDELIAAEKPSAKLKAAYRAATAAVDDLGRRLAAQRKTAADSAQALTHLGVETKNLAAAEAKLRAEAAAASSVLMKEAQAAEQAARKRRSLSREMVRAANDEAAANRALAAATKAANDQRAASTAESAMRRRISLSREMARAANDEARANRAAAEQARRAHEQEFRQQQERRAARRLAVGQAAEMAAPFVLGGAVRSVKEGAALEHEVARARAAGLTESEIAENAALAAELSRRYPTMSNASGMHALRNFRSVVGSSEEAAHIADPLFKMRYVVEAAHPGRILEDDFDKLIKGMEIKGVTQDMGKFHDYIQGMTQALNTFGDTLRASDYYEMFKYGRQSTQTLDRDYMLQVAPTLAQELGGQGAGNAHASFYSGFIGGRLKAAAIQQLEEMGLVGDESKIIRHPTNGRILGANSGFLKDSALAARNPYEWVQTVMLPAITARVGDDPEKIQEVISGLASNRVAAQFLAILATQQSRIEKDRRLVTGAPGLEAYDAYQKDPVVAWKGMITQFDNLLAVASSPSVAQAAGAMQSIAAGLASLAEVAKDHPIASGGAVAAAGAAGFFGTYKLLGGLLGGFGLRGSALALDASAAALTEAAVALGARGLAPNGAPIGPGAPRGTPPVPPKGPSLLRRLYENGRDALVPFARRVLSPPAIFAEGFATGNYLTLKGLEDGSIAGVGADPLGERYRATHPKFDADAARRRVDEHGDLVREMRREHQRGEAMSSPDRITHEPTGPSSVWEGAASSGTAAGAAAGAGVADGLGRQSALVRGAAEQIFAEIETVFARGVTVPVRVDAQSVAALHSAVQSKAEARVAAMVRSTYDDLDTA